LVADGRDDDLLGLPRRSSVPVDVAQFEAEVALVALASFALETDGVQLPIRYPCHGDDLKPFACRTMLQLARSRSVSQATAASSLRATLVTGSKLAVAADELRSSRRRGRG
jgi:hypothetical protein